MLHRVAKLTILICAGALGACVLVEHDHDHGPADRSEARRGPPPHAPAHGYRNKQQGSVDLILDSETGVYVVVGWPDHYWYRDHYFRWEDGRWMISIKLDGGWSDCSPKALPPGLAKKHGRVNGPVPASPRR